MEDLNQPAPGPEGQEDEKEPVYIRSVRLEDFPPGSRRVVRAPDYAILLLNVEGELYALSNICPHTGGLLQYGPLDGYILECPLHYWPFDVRTGCLVNMNQESLLDENVPTYPVVVDEGYIYIQIE